MHCKVSVEVTAKELEFGEFQILTILLVRVGGAEERDGEREDLRA